MRNPEGMTIFDTETHESLCRFPAKVSSSPAFSPCSEWISCVNRDTQCAEVRHVRTGALEHSFGDEGGERWGTAWSPCGTKLLSCCRENLQVWDIATGDVVHEWSHIVGRDSVMVVTGDRVAMSSKEITIRDYTTGVEVLVLSFNSAVVHYVALTPNQRFIAACTDICVRVWNIETGECVFEDVSGNDWTDVAVSNDVVAAYCAEILCLWSISTGKQLLCRDCDLAGYNFGLAISSCGGVVMYGRDKGVEIVDI